MIIIIMSARSPTRETGAPAVKRPSGGEGGEGKGGSALLSFPPTSHYFFPSSFRLTGDFLET